jgi:hypothetical protein
VKEGGKMEDRERGRSIWNEGMEIINVDKQNIFTAEKMQLWENEGETSRKKYASTSSLLKKRMYSSWALSGQQVFSSNI